MRNLILCSLLISSTIASASTRDIIRPIPIPVPAPSPRKIVLPNPRYSTLQSAVEAVADAGEVVLRPGSYTGATINNKKITISGAQGRNDVVINGKFEIGETGEAAITNLTINANDTWGIIKSNNKVALNLSNVRINNGGVISYGDAAIDRLEINNPLTGLALYQYNKLILKTVDVNNASGFGIWAQGLDNCNVDLALIGVRRPGRQGIILKGKNCNGSAQYLRVEDAKLAGVQVEDFNSLTINGSTILRTVPGVVNGSIPINVQDGSPLFGDAVLTLWSNVTLLNNNLNNNLRTGATILGCNTYRKGSLALGNNNLFANGFDIEIDTLALPGQSNSDCDGAGELKDLGGNQCGPSSESPLSCKARSSSIEPLPR